MHNADLPRQKNNRTIDTSGKGANDEMPGWLRIVVVVIAASITIGASIEIINDATFLAHAARASGRVLTVFDSSHVFTNGDGTARVEDECDEQISFRPASSKPVIFSDKFGTGGFLTGTAPCDWYGNPVMVLYNSRYPSDARLATAFYQDLNVSVLTVVFCGLPLLLLLLCCAAEWRTRRRKRAAEFGYPEPYRSPRASLSRKVFVNDQEQGSL